jgi:flagellar biogenesis protein FliO
LASGPTRKRPVSASRATSSAEKRAPRTGFRVPRPAPLVLDDDAPSENYALRLTEALEAISAAQADGTHDSGQATEAPAERGTRNTERGTFASWLTALDKLPPIKLPVGPAVPWRLGLPALVAVAVVMVFVSRPSGRADAQGVRLPAQETYAVQQEAPLFAQQASTPAANAQPSSAQPASAQPAPAIGVQDPGGLGFDFLDVGFKLIAVLALAYGSLVLLKRVGLGNAGGAGVKTGGTLQGMRVISTLALAPNRSVHVLKVPGGKTLVVGATPNQVNLIADLGDIAEEAAPDAASFFDVLKSKIGN